MPDPRSLSDRPVRNAYTDLIRAVEEHRVDRAAHLIDAMQRGDMEHEAEVSRLRAGLEIIAGLTDGMAREVIDFENALKWAKHYARQALKTGVATDEESNDG